MRTTSSINVWCETKSAMHSSNRRPDGEQRFVGKLAKLPLSLVWLPLRMCANNDWLEEGLIEPLHVLKTRLLQQRD